MNDTLRAIVIFTLCMVMPAALKAQHDAERQPHGDTAAVLRVIGGGGDRLLPAEVTPVAEPHSPGKAFRLSFLPGAGQVYNRQAWKVPIIYGIMGGLAYWAYDSRKSMVKFRDEYLLRVGGGESQLEGYTSYADKTIYNLYNSNNQYFQLAIVLEVVAYGLNLLDAYVYGHLFDFQIDDNISLRVAPSLAPDAGSPLGWAPAMGMSLTF